MDGRRCLIVSELPGVPLSEISGTLPDSVLKGLYQEAGRLLRKIHELDCDAFGYISTKIVDPFTSNQAYMMSRFSHRLRQMREFGADQHVADSLEHLFSQCANHFGSCTQAVLCHNDFHEGNLLVARKAEGWAISGLVDFENMIAADPVLDLAKTYCYTAEKRELKWDALRSGYGQLDAEWSNRFRLYLIFHDLELWSFLREIGVTEPLVRIMESLKDRLTALESQRT